MTSMDFWVIFWKIIFVGVVVLFGFLAVYVSFKGAGDIVSLMRTLRERHREQDGNKSA